MERLELLERLAAITGGLTPARGVSEAQLIELRQLLARELPTLVPAWRLVTSGGIAHDRIDLDAIGPELRVELERALDAPPPAALPADELGVAPRVARRTLPFSTSAEPDSVPEWAAGRRVEWTLGPFVDRDGRLVWFDIFAIVR
ncbi:MAG TPA: hypothetical protein VN494_07665, partial [Patescibacteria group bacterium]|nr:hypothetical protein [Patescibacteria group bacterium]